MPNREDEEDVALTLKQDEPSAKKKCILIIRQMEFRCMNASVMNYELSSYYDGLHFKASVVSSVAAGMAALPVAKILSTAQSLSSSRFTSVGLGVLFAATTASVAYSKGAEYLLPNLLKKTKDYNRAGAAWQRLELNIRAFLASTTKDQTTVREYRKFIDECAERREEICNIARPEQWSYQKYNSTSQYVLERYRRRIHWHQEFRRHQKEFEDEYFKN